ncbi:SDR family NAD(P)-dependent oxidoreductase [Flavobacterium granuli]|uniref:NAD(P)-dependent dehydrogenase (Short-subunit alcohol dehydrogenase family) n=1 Tax=Flavobacterium granuli TaxID=280093 RepID=A0ABU1S2T7_9FLAO|nr:SDR family NAD(P)-dependent oxidoreductase [Flavobacterium granuli]MDR6844965.1 NAD(P)-dependent dehydrogenase (short-subunit alcohol dehydrogenase family) [Flavobacterium granuli]
MKKTVLLTGASKGIGYALFKLFIENGYNVIGTSRTETKLSSTDNSAEHIRLDLADMESIKKFEKFIIDSEIKIDILVNNAAIGPDLNTSLPDENSFRQTFDTNVTGTVFFTESMLNHLNENGKIINISSKMGSIAVCQKNDSVAYRMSKTALNMYSKILTNRLLGKQSIATIHPGWVKTELTENNINAPLSKEESAKNIFEFIQSDYKTGIYWDAPEKIEIEW